MIQYISVSCQISCPFVGSTPYGFGGSWARTTPPINWANTTPPINMDKKNIFFIDFKFIYLFMNYYTPKLLLFICLLAFSCQTATTKEDPLAKASRQDTNGWIYVHLEGSPSTIGYQHGSL